MVPIERASGIAVWRQIEDRLAADIRNGVWGEGDRLPTEAMLSHRFGVNRHTLRRAVSSLADRGLLRVEQGRGIFVRENVLEYLVGRRTRFTENVRRANRAPGGRSLSLRRTRADRETAAALRLKPGTAVVVLETVGEVDGRPISYGEHWFPAKLFPDFAAAYEPNHSVTAVMEHHGFGDYERAVTKVTARMPDTRDAEVLAQPRTRPILYAESLNVDGVGTALQLSHVRYAADRFQMVLETRADVETRFGLDD